MMGDYLGKFFEMKKEKRTFKIPRFYYNYICISIPKLLNKIHNLSCLLYL